MPPTIVPRTSNHTARIPLTGALTQRTRRDAVANVPKLDPGCYLAVEDGDDVVVVPVDAEAFRIGRSPSADLNLDDVTVSRRHALILLQDGVARVVDDRSLNGVEVNGERVRDATLSNSDEIALGRVRMRWVHVPAE